MNTCIVGLNEKQRCLPILELKQMVTETETNGDIIFNTFDSTGAEMECM
jgi:hypothetical protein